jgi:ribA/ribD-fused uncharacterized protein
MGTHAHKKRSKRRERSRSKHTSKRWNRSKSHGTDRKRKHRKTDKRKRSKHHKTDKRKRSKHHKTDKRKRSKHHKTDKRKRSKHHKTDRKRKHSKTDKRKHSKHHKTDKVAAGKHTEPVSAPVASVVFFYDKGRPFYEFTNFYTPPGGVMIDGRSWPTTEHYFQASKFPAHPSLQEAMRRMSDARAVFNSAASNAHMRRSDWFTTLKHPFGGRSDKLVDSVRDAVMIKALLAKFADRKLAKLLLSTGDAELVEDAGTNDKYWGNGQRGSVRGHGENKLGRMLGYLRHMLQRGKTHRITDGLRANAMT